MKKIYSLIIAALVAMSIVGCNGTEAAPAKPKKIQNVQVYSAPNADGAITAKTVEQGFDAVGLSIAGNNDMNKPFSLRFNKTHYKVYNLAMFSNAELTLKLIKKYPNFGALTPLTMSIWSDDEAKTMNVSTLNIHGMARAAGIPVTDPDLIAYADLVQKALTTGMPNGTFKDLDYTVKFPDKKLATDFVVELEEDADPATTVEDFEAEFEGELEPLGFLLPNYSNLQEEIFDDAGYTGVYDFYHTYSICKFDVIFPVSKLHPEAGAWAPCSFYIYKKSDENIMRMGFLSVDNWITTLDIEDEESIKPLREAQGMIEKIIKNITE
ncbi:MAG: hypothetical protein JXQ67_00955 [Campylobacterales bacterium]|nr:hypothetical protein [Campylobacterales bacterium]